MIVIANSGSCPLFGQHGFVFVFFSHHTTFKKLFSDKHKGLHDYKWIVWCCFASFLSFAEHPLAVLLSLHS